jgi:hypothetical protein
LDPHVGIYLLAAGWFLHGVWDFVHLRIDKVDVLVAVQLLFLV